MGLSYAANVFLLTYYRPPIHYPTFKIASISSIFHPFSTLSPPNFKYFCIILQYKIMIQRFKNVILGDGYRPNDELFSVFITSLLFFVFALFLVMLYLYVAF